MNKPRLGIHLPIGSSLTREECLALTVRAEELGYDSVWAGESWGFDAFTVLTEIAVQTSRIRLGTHIATIFSRTPAMLAQSAASLDLISGGRLTLGIGTSGPKVVTDWHGQHWDRPIQRTRDTITIVRKILSGQRVDHESGLFRLAGFRLRFEPVNRHLPIMVASIGPNNISMTGEVADGWLPIFTPDTALQEQIPQLKSGVTSAGRDPSGFEIAPSYLTGIGSQSRSAARSHLAFYIGGMGSFYSAMMDRAGFGQETASIRDAWAVPNRDGRSHAASLVTDPLLDSTSAVGSVEHAKRRLQVVMDQGATLPILMFPHGLTRSDIGDTVENLAPTSW